VDGAEMTVLSILNVVLTDEWDLEDWQTAMLSSVVFIGMILGTFISGTFSDLYGRLFMFNVSSWSLLVVGVISVFMPEFYSFMFIRGLVGVSIGMGLPVAASYTSEICPGLYRGSYMVLLEAFFTCGQIFIVFIAFMLMPGLDDTSKYRELLFIAVTPILIANFLSFFVMKESPRFLAMKQKVVEAIEVLNIIARYNKAEPLDYDEEKVVGSMYPLSIEQSSYRFKILFNETHICNTIKLISLWFVAIFTFYGFFFILPVTMDDESEGNIVLLGLLIATFSGIPSNLVNIYIIESNYLGRKKTIIFSLIGQALFLVLTGSLYENEGLIVSAAGVNFFCNIWFNTLYPYTCEIYETEIRGMALGYFNTIARLGGAVAPIILIYLHQLSPRAPHYFMAGLSLIAFGIACKLPVETRGRQLDKAIIYD
jgi:putative MFS transporter